MTPATNLKTCRCGAQHSRVDSLCADCRVTRNKASRAASQKGARSRQAMATARERLQADECEHGMPRYLCRACWSVFAREKYPDAPVTVVDAWPNPSLMLRALRSSFQ